MWGGCVRQLEVNDQVSSKVMEGYPTLLTSLLRPKLAKKLVAVKESGFSTHQFIKLSIQMPIHACRCHCHGCQARLAFVQQKRLSNTILESEQHSLKKSPPSLGAPLNFLGAPLKDPAPRNNKSLSRAPLALF